MQLESIYVRLPCGLNGVERNRISFWANNFNTTLETKSSVHTVYANEKSDASSLSMSLAHKMKRWIQNFLTGILQFKLLKWTAHTWYGSHDLTPCPCMYGIVIRYSLVWVKCMQNKCMHDMIWNKCMQVFFGTYSSAADDAGVACFFFRVKNVEARWR